MDKKEVTLQGLRKGAFTEAIDPDGKRFGWTGLGELLDTENFYLALVDGRFCGFSYRLDERRPSVAVIRLQLAEQIRKEESEGKKVGAKRKRELREAITENLLAECDFAPQLIDCIWDSQTSRLFIGTLSLPKVDRILAHFKGTFGIEAKPVAPEKDMASVFSAIQEAGGINVNDFYLAAAGSASLRSNPQDSEKSSISVRNDADAVIQALDRGMTIKKITFEAQENGSEDQITFTLDDDLLVSGLRLPKADKQAGDEGAFLINAERLSQVADLVAALSQEKE